MTEFEGMAPAIAAALSKRGYTTLTPVQKAVIASDLEGRDALVSAQTGSGKTVAFGLALAPDLLSGHERFERPGAPLALIVAPTRELALQVMRELSWLYAEAGATVATCVGGMDPRTERRTLERGAHIVVGTPGRLRDHITRGALDMSEIRAVVLDEADEMLDLGFREDLEFILEEAPDDRRTLMFSATVPRAIETMAQNYQKNAVRLETASESRQHGDIEYRALVVAPADRENAIVNVLRFYEAKNAIVFCSTRAAVNHLTARFTNRGFAVVALSGELSQNERTHALQAMRDGRARVCIATDVAARGIDLPGLELVIHADLPTNSETLLHRSGRTGRAGNKGVSALIVPLSARRKAERLLSGANVVPNWALPPSADEVTARDHERLATDPAIAEPLLDDERDAVATLVANHTPEQLATAFLRLWSAGHSAPEDLIEVQLDAGAKRARKDATDGPVDFGPARARTDFAGSLWFSLSVGRKQRAEPRWLIPMLCRAGKISKSSIGAIRMREDETFVEIDAASEDVFLGAIGPKMTIEKGIRLTQIDGKPDLGGGSAREASDGERRPPRADRAPRDDARPAKPRGEWTDKPRGDYADKPRKAGGWKRDGEGDARSANARPYAKREGGNDKPRGEKAYGEKSFGDKRPKPKGEWQDAPARKSAAGDRPRFNDGEAAMRREDDRAWKTNESASDRPARKFADKFADKGDGKPYGDRSFKPRAKPAARADGNAPQAGAGKLKKAKRKDA